MHTDSQLTEGNRPARLRKGEGNADISTALQQSVLIVNLADNQTISIPRSGDQQGYELTRLKDVAGPKKDTQVILAHNGDKNSPFVVKTTLWQGDPRNARAWLREYRIHKELNHVRSSAPTAIVQLVELARAKVLYLNSG